MIEGSGTSTKKQCDLLNKREKFINDSHQMLQQTFSAILRFLLSSITFTVAVEKRRLLVDVVALR